MEKVYEAAAAKCPDSEGVDGWFLWLGRVNRNGVITKTHRSSESEFPKCMDSKLLGVKVKRPPKWNQAGYPVMFMYGPVGH
jgi:hypothetical protein